MIKWQQMEMIQLPGSPSTKTSDWPFLGPAI